MPKDDDSDDVTTEEILDSQWSTGPMGEARSTILLKHVDAKIVTSNCR